MPDRDREKIIRALFAAYLANDRQAIENFLTDDFRFTSPYDDEIDKATYFVRCWRASDWIERHQLEKIIVAGDGAFVTYRCVARDGKSFSQYRIHRLRGRPDQAHRRLFRRHLSGRRLRPADRKLRFVRMSLTLHPLASYGHKALIALSEDDVALTARNNSIGHVGAAKARSSY